MVSLTDMINLDEFTLYIYVLEWTRVDPPDRYTLQNRCSIPFEWYTYVKLANNKSEYWTRIILKIFPIFTFIVSSPCKRAGISI